jgi:ABC-type branched-subunit amino acid transport system substrate-binding protein
MMQLLQRSLYFIAVSTLCLSSCTREAPEKTEPAAPAEPGAPAAPAAPAVTDIKLGQTMPYSGPASAYSTIGKIEIAYFKMINEQGGINGRKIQLISLDDGYSPPKALEQARKLVEEEQVLAMFNPLGTANNSAMQKYLNQKKVPQLFVSSGATKWADPTHYPWTIGLNPSYQLEGRVYAQHILKNSPKAKIAVLYQNDDYGKDILKGLKDGLGANNAKMIVAEATYEASDATVDSQIVTLKASKADTFIDISTPKFAAQAIRKVHDSNWKAKHYINNNGASRGAVLAPAGFDKAKGMITAGYFFDLPDDAYADRPAVKKYIEFLAKYYPEGKLNDGSNAYGYIAAQVMAHVIKQCGDDVSRENLMKQATNIKDFSPDLVQDGVVINTSPTDFFPFDQLRIARFDGTNWVPEGDAIQIDLAGVASL